MEKMEIPTSGKVMLKPIIKQTWLPAGHDGEFRFTGTFERLTPQLIAKDLLNTGLTEEDERWFEQKMNLKQGSLSRYNREYWGKFFIDVGAKGKVLDLSMARHRLEYMVLLAHQMVAKSEADIPDQPWAKYYLSSEEQEGKVKSAVTEVRSEAYAVFLKMTAEEMIDINNVMDPGKRLQRDSQLGFIKQSVEQLVLNRPGEFLATLNEPNFKIKTFIDKCISARLVTKNGPRYTVVGGGALGNSLNETIEFLSAPENQSYMISLMSKLELATKG